MYVIILDISLSLNELTDSREKVLTQEFSLLVYEACRDQNKVSHEIGGLEFAPSIFWPPVYSNFTIFVQEVSISKN